MLPIRSCTGGHHPHCMRLINADQEVYMFSVNCVTNMDYRTLNTWSADLILLAMESKDRDYGFRMGLINNLLCVLKIFDSIYMNIEEHEEMLGPLEICTPCYEEKVGIGLRVFQVRLAVTNLDEYYEYSKACDLGKAYEMCTTVQLHPMEDVPLAKDHVHGIFEYLNKDL